MDNFEKICVKFSLTFENNLRIYGFGNFADILIKFQKRSTTDNFEKIL